MACLLFIFKAFETFRNQFKSVVVPKNLRVVNSKLKKTGFVNERLKELLGS